MSDENQFQQPGQFSPMEETVPDVPRPVSPTEATVPGPQGSSWPPAQPMFQRQEPFPVGIIILVVVLTLVLIGAGFGFILYTTTAQYRATLGNAATSAALSTVQVQDTAQAKNH